MIFVVLLFFTALLISSIAAYFSIVGLTLIFSAAPVPIAIMGGALELGKLVTASFLYRSWHEINNAMRTYFIASVVLLSLITSLGIFGYLSKSYISDSASIYTNEVLLKSKQELLEIEKNRLTVLLKRGENYTRSVRIENQIQDTQNKIYELTTEIGQIRGQKNALGTEIGPIRYISELIYGKGDLDTIDKAVRLIIVAIMFVFDPLAILLVIAANMQMNIRKRAGIVKKTKDSIELDKSAVFNFNDKDLKSYK